MDAPPEFGTFAPTPLQSAVIALGRRLPLSYIGKRVSGWLRDVLRAITRGPIDLVVVGQHMRLHLGNNACERRLAVTPQFFDPVELAVLASMCGPNFRFVDVGANVGTYALNVALHCGSGSRILAIEPHPTALERLRTNIALNEKSITVVPEAVSDRAGEIDITVDSNNIGFSSIHAGRKGRGKPHTIRVAVRPLLTILEENGFDRIDAMKVDIEGAEDRALLPFFAAAPSSLWPSVLIIEDNGELWRDDLIQGLLEIGYTADKVKADNLIWRLDRASVA